MRVNLTKRIIKTLMIFLLIILSTINMISCFNSKETVIIYSSAEDYRLEYLANRLEEEFPEYNIIIEYMSTGNHAAKLLAEGINTECDIIYDLEYGYLAQLDEKGVLEDLSGYDYSVYLEDTIESKNYAVEYRNGGAIIINTDVLERKGLPEPASYQDLLKPEYKGLISMPSPKSSGTGYMFLKSLVNAWGEDDAFSYFDKLTQNILQYTSSGSGPVNALVQGEAAIGLGMTGQAVVKINDGAPVKVLYFDEGSPYCFYGQAMIKTKGERESVRKVFDFLINTYSYENNEKFFPEKIFKDKDYTLENYPTNIVYSDMKNNTLSEKQRLLDKWKY